MATVRPLPSPDVPMINMATGRVSEAWYLYFQSREKIGLTNLADVSATAPTNGQVLIYNSTTLKYTPGAN